jgi:flavin reductase (DIM6/NTAB) family NADH-FMN oxidoreductase RutF
MTRISVPLSKSYRLLNHGPTVLVSAAHSGVQNVMAAAWNMALDFTPAKVCVVIAKNTMTRGLIEASGEFVLNVPSRGIAKQTLSVGNESGRDVDTAVHTDKFDAHNLRALKADAMQAPLVAGCVAWLECKLIAEPHNQEVYDLFIGEVIAASADSRVFEAGHWTYSNDTPTDLQTLHYIAGRTFLTVGAPFTVE